MKTTTHSTVRAHVHLDRIEEFRFTNDEGREFFVNYITYSGGENVSLRGPARNKNGERGFVHRTGVMDRRALMIAQPRMHSALILARRLAIRELGAEVDQ